MSGSIKLGITFCQDNKTYKIAKNPMKLCGTLLERWFYLLFGNICLFPNKGGFNLRPTKSGILSFCALFTYFSI